MISQQQQLHRIGLTNGYKVRCIIKHIKYSAKVDECSSPATGYAGMAHVSVISPESVISVSSYFYLCIYRYGSSLSVYGTRRRTLAAVSQTISLNYCILY